ncbi:MAG: restriction endonuclease subunit S [Fuerstiella sp.]
MTPQEFLDEFGTLGEAEGGVQKLREMILELAVRGKLVEQDESELPASELLESIKESGANNGKKRAPRRNEASSLLHDPPFAVPSSWEWSPFNRVATIASNLVKPAEFLDLPHVAPNNIEKYNGQLLEYRSVREDGVKSNNHRFFAGQILYSKIRPNLSKATIVDFDGLCSADMYPLDSHIDARYLLTFILSFPFLQMAVKTDTRVAMPKINQAELNQVLVAVPPLAEQHRIVAKVDELMRLCDGLEAVQKQRRGVRLRLNRSSLDRLTVVQSPAQVSAAWQRVCDHFQMLYDTPETLPDLRQTILQLAVQGKLVKQDPNDEPAEQLLEKLTARREKLIANGDLKKSKIVPITDGEFDITAPAHWQWSRLNDLVEVMNSGWSPPCEPNPTIDESEWGVLKTTSVQSFVFWEHKHKRLPDNLKPRPEAEAKQGDLLMTRAGPQNRVGISCLVRKVRPRLMISDKIIRFHLIEPFMYDEFVALCLNAGVSQEHIEKSKSGMAASQMNISQMKFRMTPIPVPPRAEQKRIVSKVTDLLSQVTRLESTLTRREATRTQLLTAAIHGILGPNP